MTTTLTSASGILHLGVPVLGLRRRSDDCRPAVLLQSPIDRPEVVVVILRAHRLVENRLSSAIRFCPAASLKRTSIISQLMQASNAPANEDGSWR